MGDILQIILVIMLVVVIVFFIILGIQVFFLIQEARKTITKANDFLDATGSLTSSIAEPLSAITGLAGTLSTGALLTKALTIAVKAFTKADEKKEQ